MVVKELNHYELQQISEIYYQFLEFGYSNLFNFFASGIVEAQREGLIASLIGVEGGHSLGNSLGVLRMLHDLGTKYLSLTHSCDTPW